VLHTRSRHLGAALAVVGAASAWTEGGSTKGANIGMINAEQDLLKATNGANKPKNHKPGGPRMSRDKSGCGDPLGRD